MNRAIAASVTLLIALLAAEATAAAGESWVWWEAENAASHTFPPSNAFKAWTDQEKDKLSGGDWLQTDKGSGVAAKWEVEVPKGGEYNFWTRKFWHHGPFSWRWNGGERRTCGRDCSLADAVELRKHLGANWVYLGKVKLEAGKNTLEIEALKDATAIAFDCWLLIPGKFNPDGKNKPGQKYGRADEGWFPFEPDIDAFDASAFFDMRPMNQKFAGEHGFVQAKGGGFVFEKTGEKAKFWAVVNGCDFDDRASVDYLARKLAKVGVNMVRIHSAVFDHSAQDPGEVNRKYLDKLHYFVAAMAKEGIYAKLSFYFPLWFEVKPNYGLPGFEKVQNKKPYALLFFHPRMQEIYKSWAKGLLTTKNPYTGKSFADDPAVAIVEVINEDNYFFWTFKPHRGIPGECMELLEKKFGAWLAKKHGSIEKAKEAWGPGGNVPPGDDFANGRVGLYEAGFLGGHDWAVNQRNRKRAEDTAQFLTEDLRGFYADMVKHFRGELGVKCAISATNWTTNDNRVLGALDKYTNTACDVMDRHAYFGGHCEGDGSGYSVRKDHIYTDRTGMHGPESLNPEIKYVGHPHIVSEHSYQMPNRYRTECVWLTSTYGSLAGTDGFFFFANGNADWLRANSKWPVCTPVTMGQFPAAALAYRRGYVKEGPVVFHTAAKLSDLYALKGTPASQPQNLDDLRKADIPAGGQKAVEGMIAMDPLAFYVGQVTMNVADDPGKSLVADLTQFIDRGKKSVRSATGELAWDWGKGVATCSAPCAQGACGFLGKAGSIEAGDLKIEVRNEYGAVLAVSLDGQPLKSSAKILLQVMTEDQNYGWKVEPTKVKPKNGQEFDALRIADLGAPPLEVRKFAGSVTLKRADAASLKAAALDFNGGKAKDLPGGAGGELKIELLPDCLYYGIAK